MWDLIFKIFSIMIILFITHSYNYFINFNAKITKHMKIKLHWQILIAMLLGVFYGIYLTPYSNYVSWIGDLFIRLLKMIIIPLIITSMISGITNIGSAKNFKRLGIKTFGYYILQV